MSNEVGNLLDVSGKKIMEVAGTSEAIRFMLHPADPSGKPDYSFGEHLGVFYLRPSDVRKLHDLLADAGAICGSVVNCEVFGGGDGQ